MRRQLGILALTAGLIACGGDSSQDEEDTAISPDGREAQRDGGVQRGASTRGDTSFGNGPQALPDAGRSSGAARDADATAGTSSDIDTVVSISTSVLGADGIITIYPQLVVLYEDGSGCYDVAVLKPGTNLASHRASEPSDWFKWRRGPDGKIQKLDGKTGTWKSLGAELTYPPLARGTTLSGSYTHRGVGGSLIFGGKVTAFQFSGGTFSVVAGSTTVRGAYAIDGYSLTLTDASGRREAHSIVRSGSSVWIDGAEFRSR